jgi:hypothetical protein
MVKTRSSSGRLGISLTLPIAIDLAGRGKVACAIHKTMVVASSDGTSSKVSVKTQSPGWGLWATQTFGATVCRYAATSFRSKLRINSVRTKVMGPVGVMRSLLWPVIWTRTPLVSFLAKPF